MPYSLAVDRSLERVLFKATGTFGQAEALQAILDVVNHADFRTGLDVLVDMTDVADVPLYGEDIREKADLDTTLMGRLGAANWAFVAPTDVVYGLARMYQALMDATPIRLEVFRDLEAAETWLNNNH